ncbi:MAG: hypothetical protein KDK26_06985 [Roseivivax sp.]|nr:hypothetical protein [Roseivivax sp.]
MRLVILITGLLLTALSPAWGQDAAWAPAVPKASGEPHPEGNAYMRRWHMSMMKHDRDLTMYDGERGVNASIGECFECHAVKDEAGQPVTVADERHFCRSCHDYAAVKVDCFDCHRSTPEGFEEPPHQASLGRGILPTLPYSAQMAQVLEYLRASPTVTAEARE